MRSAQKDPALCSTLTTLYKMAASQHVLFLVCLYLLAGYVAVTASTISASLSKDTIGLLHTQAKKQAAPSRSILTAKAKSCKGIDVRGGQRNLAKKNGVTTGASSKTTTIVRRKAVLEGLRSGMASGMAAACAKTLLQPLDAIKTLQQFQQTQSSSQKALSTFEAASILMKKPGGIANFYAGLGVSVLGSIPGVAIYFGVYQFAKQRFREQTEWGQEHPRVAIALAAALGNSVASATRVPYETLKQKLQMGTYESFSVMVRAVLANPMEALFPKGGILIQTIRDVPYAIATLLVYESLQEAVRKRTGTTTPKLKKQWDFIIGGVSGGIGSWVTSTYCLSNHFFSGYLSLTTFSAFRPVRRDQDTPSNRYNQSI